MTTGRINQVAAFLAHPRLQRVQGSGAPAVRTVHTPPKRAQELVSTDQVSIGHAERPTRQAVAQSTHAQLGRLPFFESSLRVLSARSSASETARLGCRNTQSRRDSRRGGCAASRPMPLKEPPGPRTDTDCSGNGFGDTLAHRVLIQAPQPRLHPGTRHRGSPPLTGLAPNQPALIRTWETEPIACSATGCSTQERGVTHQLLGSSIRLTRLSLGKLWSAAAAGSCLLSCFTSPLLDLGPPAAGPIRTSAEEWHKLRRPANEPDIRTGDLHPRPPLFGQTSQTKQAAVHPISRPLQPTSCPAPPALLPPPPSPGMDQGRQGRPGATRVHSSSHQVG